MNKKLATMVGHHTVQVINPNRHYEGHFTLYVGIACVVAASGGLIFGYDIGISGENAFCNQVTRYCNETT